MKDNDYENEYIARKKKLRKLHSSLKNSREIQEIYHKIMGSPDSGESQDELDLED